MIFPIQCVHLMHPSKPASGPHLPISVTVSPSPCCVSAGTLTPSLPQSPPEQLPEIVSHHLSSFLISLLYHSIGPLPQLPGAGLLVCPILDSLNLSEHPIYRTPGHMFGLHLSVWF